MKLVKYIFFFNGATARIGPGVFNSSPSDIPIPYSFSYIQKQ
jgi:hypothetical protein